MFPSTLARTHSWTARECDKTPAQMSMEMGATKASPLEGTKEGTHDTAADRLKDTRGGACNMQAREEILNALPPTQECTPVEDETRDK